MMNKKIRLDNNMSHIRSVNKVTFLLYKEINVTSPMRANYMVKFYSLNPLNSGASGGFDP